MKNEKELMEIIENAEVGLPLEFIFRTMKVLEIANNEMEQGTEQNTLVSNYANTFYHELKNHLSDEEIAYIEDENLLEEL